MAGEVANEAPAEGTFGTRVWGDRAQNAISVALLDPDAVGRAAFRRVLQSAGFDIAGEAGSLHEGAEILAAAQPDVIIIDATVWSESANSIAELVHHSPSSYVLLQSIRGESRPIVEAIAAGVRGHVLKRSGAEELIGVVQNVAEHGGAACPDTAAALITHLREEPSSSPVDEHRAREIRATLTERELEIFRRLPRGESNAEMARALSVADNTVKNHVASILAKLGLANRIQAAVEAVRNGMGCLTGSVVAAVLAEKGESFSELVEALIQG
jgi:two-component system, NarL family, nitrate/nitrite response regulator NarL